MDPEVLEADLSQSAEEAFDPIIQATSASDDDWMPGEFDIL